MRTMPRWRAHTALVLLTLLVAALAAGCFNPFSPLIAPVRGFVSPPPVPSSATGVLRLFEWCYNNKAIAEYSELFTADYQFLFSPLDSAGADYRGTPWRREDEIISTTQLFVGGGAESPASSILLNLDKNFVVLPDGRTPWPIAFDPTGRWHKTIRTQVLLNIRTSDGNAIDISGAARFFFVRGDSALIPDELKPRFQGDSTRWFISRWEDETVQPTIVASSGGALARLRPAGRIATASAQDLTPTQAVTWGSLKAYCLELARASGR